MKNVLIFLAGAAIMFIVLRVIKGKVTSEKATTESEIPADLLQIAKTKEARNLIKSTEFKELIKTPEFSKFVTDFGAENVALYLL